MFNFPALLIAQENSNKMETAIFAGGCFWCVESDFDKMPGVFKTTSGYTGGHKKNPAYKEVSAGGTGHTEAVEVVFNPEMISYKELTDRFWRTIDPTVKDQQFCDHGKQYRSGIFYNSPQQKMDAEQSKRDIEQNKPFKQAIVTEITQASTFYPAEDYHQDYYTKNPIRYKFYRFNCGRDARL
ncbi:MAG: peptide-methionine (S)-S-oxide reductase MsrA, partial [Gammaproteobacteria bacterium]|nr:peptide-methionine (S)-S-oxide reductase MsrA [Gammaproteobacteria bacterium]